MLEWNREMFRRMFPNLFHELEGSNVPTVLDHLEVCETEEEAVEVINYFERIGEITSEYASFLRSNAKKLGIIGTRKRGDYEKGGLVD